MATWLQRIRAARKRGYFTLKDKDDAQSWNRCALGERRHLQSLDNYQATIKLMGDVSAEVRDLAGDFSEAVGLDNFTWSERIVREIGRLA